MKVSLAPIGLVTASGIDLVLSALGPLLLLLTRPWAAPVRQAVRPVVDASRPTEG